MDRSRTWEAMRGHSLVDIVGPVVDAQTYKNLLYLFLALPLGMVYFPLVFVGLIAGIGLSVVLVGFGILATTVIGSRPIASFERWLSNTLLDTRISAPNDIEPDAHGLVATIKAYLTASSTWRGFGFVLLKFWLGVISLVLLIAFLGTAIELLLLPVYPTGVLNVEVLGWVVARSFTTSTQRLLVSPVGAVLGLVALHVLNAFAGANASVAESLLGPNSSPADV